MSLEKACPLKGLFRHGGGRGVIEAVCIQRGVAMAGCWSDFLWSLTGREPAIFFFQENSRVLKQIFLRIRDVTSYFILSPGTYAIVPAATEDQEFEFLLRIFIKNQDYHE